MASSNTDVRAVDPDGGQLQVSHTTTDSPILPAANLLQLQKIDPALVKWVVDQTQIEAEYRRKENSRVNRFVFTERISGIVVGAFVAITGLVAAAYVALQGHDWVAAILGGSTLLGIVTVLVKQRPHEKPSEQRPLSKSNKRRR